MSELERLETPDKKLDLSCTHQRMPEDSQRMTVEVEHSDDGGAEWRVEGWNRMEVGSVAAPFLDLFPQCGFM